MQSNQTRTFYTGFADLGNHWVPKVEATWDTTLKDFGAKTFAQVHKRQICTDKNITKVEIAFNDQVYPEHLTLRDAFNTSGSECIQIRVFRK